MAPGIHIAASLELATGITGRHRASNSALRPHTLTCDRIDSALFQAFGLPDGIICTGSRHCELLIRRSSMSDRQGKSEKWVRGRKTIDRTLFKKKSEPKDLKILYQGDPSYKKRDWSDSRLANCDKSLITDDIDSVHLTLFVAEVGGLQRTWGNHNCIHQSGSPPASRRGSAGCRGSRLYWLHPCR